MVIIKNRKRRLSLLGRLIHRLSPARRWKTRNTPVDTRDSQVQRQKTQLHIFCWPRARAPAAWLAGHLLFYWLSRLARCMLIVRHSKKPTHASFHQALSEAAGEPRSPSDITLATLPLLCRTRCRDAAPWLLVAPGKRGLLKRIRVLGDWRAPTTVW
jgi:hypothetical protein